MAEEKEREMDGFPYTVSYVVLSSVKPLLRDYNMKNAAVVCS